MSVPVLGTLYLLPMPLGTAAAARAAFVRAPEAP
jgi:hypothetical protein